MPRRFIAPLTLAGWILLAAPLPAQSAPELPIDSALARRHFQQASALTARDGGRLWGRSLAGPILFVDPATRTVLADSPDLEGLLNLARRIIPRQDFFDAEQVQRLENADDRHEYAGG